MSRDNVFSAVYRFSCTLQRNTKTSCYSYQHVAAAPVKLLPVPGSTQWYPATCPLQRCWNVSECFCCGSWWNKEDSFQKYLLLSIWTILTIWSAVQNTEDGVDIGFAGCLYACESWHVTLMEEHTGLETRVTRVWVSGTQEFDVTLDAEKFCILHKGELIVVYRSVVVRTCKVWCCSVLGSGVR